jgi:hypothetical protein
MQVFAKFDLKMVQRFESCSSTMKQNKIDPNLDDSKISK